MKPRLVFLTGMMCDARLFAPQIAIFQETWDIVVAESRIESSINDMAQSALEHLPNGGAIIGLSMGGIIAMEMQRIAPEKIHRLVLMDTNPFADSTENQHKRNAQIQAVQQGQLERVIRDELKPNYLANKQNTPILDLCCEMGLSLGADTFNQQSVALRDRDDLSPYLAAITCPTLIACGMQDTLCPPERHDYMARQIPDARYAVIADAGHLPTLEQPDNTNYLLYNFLGQAHE